MPKIELLACGDRGFRQLNWSRQPGDPRDHTLKMFRPLMGAAQAPVRSDLRVDCTPVEDQGTLGSCTAQALAGATEYLSVRSGLMTPPDKSRLFAYYNGRRLMGPWYVRTDSGCYIRTVVKAAVRYGICCEKEFWPYDPAKFAVKPPVSAYADASRFQITQYANIAGGTALETLANIRLALGRGIPVMFGFDVYPSFMSEEVARTGRMPLPDTRAERRQGGHAVLAVGHDDGRRMLTVRNSWGEKWGDSGYFCMPYDVILAGMASDFTVVTGQEDGATLAGWFSGLPGWLLTHREKELKTEEKA